jgi:hypothetical protein
MVKIDFKKVSYTVTRGTYKYKVILIILHP